MSQVYQIWTLKARATKVFNSNNTVWPIQLGCKKKRKRHKELATIGKPITFHWRKKCSPFHSTFKLLPSKETLHPKTKPDSAVIALYRVVHNSRPWDFYRTLWQNIFIPYTFLYCQYCFKISVLTLCSECSSFSGMGHYTRMTLYRTLPDGSFHLKSILELESSVPLNLLWIPSGFHLARCFRDSLTAFPISGLATNQFYVGQPVMRRS